MQFEKIITDRLLLRKADARVLEYVHENYSSAELLDFFGTTSDEALDKERERYAKGLTSYQRSFQYFHLIQREKENVIGWCGFHTIIENHHRAELGYGLFDEHLMRQGLMSEALPSVLNYGFETIGLNRIEAFVGADNSASMRLLEKSKFSVEGRLKGHYLTERGYEDSLLYGRSLHSLTQDS